MSAALPPVIEFKGVSKTFNPGKKTQFTALKDINFAIEDIPDYGEFVAIVGPSGCGKSTILNLIHGFDDVYPPSAGEVLVRGRKVTGPGRDRGMIFQKYSSFPHRTVLENVTFGLELNQDELSSAAATAWRAPATGSARSASAATSTSTRTSSRAASSSASRSRARWC